MARAHPLVAQRRWVDVDGEASSKRHGHGGELSFTPDRSTIAGCATFASKEFVKTLQKVGLIIL